MNENLQPLGNEHLEARITAYALGEASPFEAEEIKALCAQNPELQIFLNRTIALHQLLEETQIQTADSSWKLSPEKRSKLNPILGPDSSQPKNQKEHSIRRAAFRTAFGIAAILILTLTAKHLLFREPKVMHETSSIVNYSATPDRTEELRRAIREQEDKVEEQRKILTTISRTKNLVYDDTRDTASSGGLDEDSTAKYAINNFTQLKGEKLQLESQIESLQKYDDEQLLIYSAGLDLPDNTVKTLYPQYLEQKRQIDKLKASGLAENHPSIQSNRKALDSIKSNLDQGVENLSTRLEGQLDLTEERLSKVEARKMETKQDALSRSIDAQDYADAKHNFETDKKLLGQMKLKLLEAESAENVSRDRSLIASNSRSSISGEKKPSAPSAFKAKSIASNSPSPTSIPVPELALNEPSSDFGDGDRFGGGFAAGKFRGNNAYLGQQAAATYEQAERSNREMSKGKIAAIDDSIRTNPALTSQQTHDVDEVRRKLYTAQGNFDLGKYDDAKNAYEDALRIDPYNSDARLGMQKIASATTDYYRAAYDHTRSELLMQVDQAWELSVPADPVQESDPFAAPGAVGKDLPDSEFDGFVKYGEPIARTQDRIDFTTKHVEITQENSDLIGYAWMPGLTEQGATQTLNNPLTGILSKEKLVELSQEIATAQEPFSTFSLNISDASFQIARTAIDKGERPDPASIKPEQFYNAVDYGDPAPRTQEPVAASIDQTAHPIIPGRNLIRIGIRTASTGRSEAQPLRLTLLVDQSGSMVRSDRRAAMDSALEQLETLLTEKDEITVIGFSRTPTLLADSLPGNQAHKLSDLINQTANEGGTNIEAAINLATELALRDKLVGAQNRIVLFTDGAANLGNANPERLSEKIKNIRLHGLAFDIAGIGTENVNDRLLAELARHGNGRYYLVNENTGAALATQLAGAFRPAAENVKIQVKLNPQRVANYKLIGFEKDRLKTEDFRNDAVDAAELAADEAGIAIYQVEPLPEGSGEIGEISVRFRDTASGEMVERTWTIPHLSTTPAFDQADPKTQLATLSLLAAQKLQGGPLANAIDFSNFTQTLAELRQTYKANAKTQQMLTLIDALK